MSKAKALARRIYKVTGLVAMTYFDFDENACVSFHQYVKTLNSIKKQIPEFENVKITSVHKDGDKMRGSLCLRIQ